MEMAMMQYEQNRSLDWEMLHHVSRRFSILPASVFAVPDYPVVTKVSIDALKGFVPALQRLAGEYSRSWLILECQGQLNSPMTFFSLEAADQVVIPLGKPTDAAYALASVRRLAQVYHHQTEKFILAAAGNVKAIKGAALTHGRDGVMLDGVRILPWDSRKLKAALPVDNPRRRQVAESAPIYL